ncbi:MAG: 50S ribosomal protein L15 [Patescibacteria group bacterium]
MGLHNLNPKFGAKKKRKLLGRGNASGHGTYSTRGLKGQKARTGSKKGILKRKGMRHLLLSIPKARGFKSIYFKPATVNLDELNKHFKDGEKVTPEELIKKGVLVQADVTAGVKILNNGELSKKLEINGCRVSAGAKEKIEKAGGSIIEDTNQRI